MRHLFHEKEGDKRQHFTFDKNTVLKGCSHLQKNYMANDYSKVCKEPTDLNAVLSMSNSFPGMIRRY